MVADFNVAKSPKDIAFYASLLAAAFPICQMMTIMYWSRLSDRIGRRPVLMIGLLGYLVSFLMFGICRSFYWALFARCINGLLAGNVAVIKSVFAEISDDTNRPRMMALLPLMWNLGSVGGAAIGGIFADPTHQYPRIFGHMEIFRVFPYLLPCLIGCSITVFGLVMGIFKMEETLVREPASRTMDIRMSPTSPSSSTSTLATESTQLLTEPVQPKQRSMRELLTPTVVRVMATNVVMGLGVAMSDQAYPIFAASDLSDGGLGFAARGIGFSLAVSGVAVMYLQLVAYPKLERKYGALDCYQRGQRMLIPVYLAIPFLSLLTSRLEESIDANTHVSTLPSWMSHVLGEYTLWLLLVLLLLARSTGTVLAFTSINLLTVNLAPSKSELGFMNGTQQLAMTTTRIAGPIMAGVIWTWSIKHSFPYPFNSHMVWVLCAALTALSLRMSHKIPESVNTFAAGNNKRDTADDV
ncbi:hypothetical protein LPJ77_000296 [Coemansia sp. RSA 2523]|nr:hypothetical protein LPJ77_000296 [Coemansia sp. RSA 2523]KAJ2430165.1 hypothetical protein GGF47_000242 [Coemansia sp. RSA 2524]KAJ2724201.1 hypothetical protein H4S00_002328 [Coemansia sp. D1744]